MEKNIKDVDIVILRRRRKRRRQMAKFIAFILLASIIFGLGSRVRASHVLA